MSDVWDATITVDGVEIRYRCHKSGPKPKAKVLILPGFTEFVEKHEETANHFAAMGVDSLILDWPGQGLSGRLSPEYPLAIHADGFEFHFKALNAVADDAGYLSSGLPVFLFGPMIMPPVQPPWLILALARGIGLLPFVAKAPVMFRQSRGRDETFFPENVLTRDAEGYALQVNWWKSNPRLKTTGPTYGWVRTAYQSCSDTTANPSWMSRLDLDVSAHVPLDEVVVSLKHSLDCLPKIPGIEIYEYKDARHELLLELPGVRKLFWRRVERFVEKCLAARTKGTTKDRPKVR
ncbi:MAG: alpha/beta hydrolase [Alphaproteobacteria bacterium]|nr:alpha/beta hydrolase [Alphaproteobacteria bacterium]